MHIVLPLRSRPVALLWGGLSLSAVGDQLYAVALTWIAVGVFGSAAGYLSALQALVVLLAVLGLGRWADQWDPRVSMIGADLARAAVLLIVVAMWLVSGTPRAAPLIVAVVVLAMGQAIFQPALQTVLPPLVPDARLLPAANGLLDATDRTARLLGPGLVAFLAGVLPAVHFLTLDALSFLASALALAWIRRLRPRLPAAAPERPARATPRGIARGVRAMLEHPLLGYILATVGPLNGAWYAVFFLGLPLLIAQRGVQGPGGSGLGAYGLVISAYGLTNLAATLVVGSRALPARPQFQMFGGTLLVGTGMLLMALATALPTPWLLPALAGAAVFGAVGGPMKDIPLAVLRQTRLARADVPAAMRAYMAAASAGMLAAMLLAPAAIALSGAVPVIVACGILLLGIGLIGLVRHAGWVETLQPRTA